jgi:thiol-disulfide isomerase/thioredoxin
MSYLAAAVVILGLLCLVNLALTFVLIRRVSGLSAQPGGPAGFRPASRVLPPGSQVPGFAVTTVSGTTRSLDDLAGSRSLLGFFSLGCPPCRDAVPEFIDFARTIPGGTSQVLAIVCGPEGTAAESLARELHDAASVVIEPRQGPAAKAFQVSGYPRFFVLDDSGRIEASGPSMPLLLSAGLASSPAAG